MATLLIELSGTDKKQCIAERVIVIAVPKRQCFYAYNAFEHVELNN